MIWWLALSTFVFHILQPPWDASTILTNYLNASWEIRYPGHMWHRCVKRSRFVFLFFLFPVSFLHGWILEMGISGKERAIDQPYLSPVHTWTTCDYQRLTISAWPLNGYLLEMKVTRFECQQSIGDSISLPPPLHSFHSLSLNTIRVKRCRCSIP